MKERKISQTKRGVGLARATYLLTQRKAKTVVAARAESTSLDITPAARSDVLKACFDSPRPYPYITSQPQPTPTQFESLSKAQHHFLNITTMPAQTDVEMQYQSAQQMDPTKPSPSDLAVSLAPESNAELITDS